MNQSIPVRTAFASSALVGLALLGGCGSSSSTGTTSAARPASMSTPSATSAVTTSASASTPAAAPASSAPATASSSATAAARPTVLPTPTGALKKAASAKLPSKMGSYTGQVTAAGATTTNGMYTGATQDQMLMVALVKGGDVRVFASRLAGASVDGHAVCGKQEGLATCVLPLQGGYISVVGTDRDAVASVGTLSNTLWAALA